MPEEKGAEEVPAAEEAAPTTTAGVPENSGDTVEDVESNKRKRDDSDVQEGACFRTFRILAISANGALKTFHLMKLNLFIFLRRRLQESSRYGS